MTLRNELAKSQQWHREHYGVLGWQWTDEGIPYAILDYHSGVGSTFDFTDDDWAAAEECGWSREEVEELCEMPDFQSEGID